VHEIAERAGVSRQTLRNAQAAGGGVPERRLNVDVRVACAPARLRQATISPGREWTVYIASTAEEANAIVAAAELFMGKHAVALIPAGTRGDMDVPEVAWRVEASNSEDAMQAAIGRMRALRESVDGLDPDAPVVVKAFVYPQDAR
jgi:hypothetical protein